MVRSIVNLNFVPLVILCVSCCSVFGCKKATIDRLPLPLGKEIILDTALGSIEFDVEIADNQKTRSKGLSGRKTLAKNHGMLFIFSKTGNHRFWMKDTYIPLDLIFFNDDLIVVGIKENAVPMSLENIEIEKDSRYVLEVLAGSVKKYGIKVNDRAQLN